MTLQDTDSEKQEPKLLTQSQELAEFLDSMLLSAPMASPEKIFADVQSTEQQIPEKKGKKSTTDQNKTPKTENRISASTRRSPYDELSLMFGLVNHVHDLPEIVFNQDDAVLEICKRLYSDKASFKDLYALLFAVVTVGNLTASRINFIPPPMTEMVETAMKNLGVKFVEHGPKPDPYELDFAGFSLLFPADMFKILKHVNFPACLRSFLPPEVRGHIPPELTFLQVGALSCVLSEESDRKKLKQVVTYLNDQFCKRSAKVTGHDIEKIRQSVLRSQGICSTAMSMIMTNAIDESDLVESLSRVTFPAKSVTYSRKRVNGKRMVKVPSSKQK